tara:strand:+ start:4266 stop:4799 length:534 start_codon:yes stop_codon:yes gene_type:complete
MTAFDRAFALLKMPIVPGSFEEDSRGDWEGRFRDPVSDENLPLIVMQQWSDGGEPVLAAEIVDEKGIDRARATAEHIGEDDEDRMDAEESQRQHIAEHDWMDEDHVESYPRNRWEGEGAETQPDFQQRGYMSAIYDALATILSRKHKRDLFPNALGQTDLGSALWGDKDTWPVRDDL